MSKFRKKVQIPKIWVFCSKFRRFLAKISKLFVVHDRWVESVAIFLFLGQFYMGVPSLNHLGLKTWTLSKIPKMKGKKT